MRILHVIPWLSQRYGGPPILVPQASAALSTRGHSVEIVTTNADGPTVLDVPTGRAVRWAGASVTFHPLATPRWYVTSWSMLRDLRRRVSTFDVVHIHYLYRFHAVAAAIVAHGRGIPYVVQPHGSLDPWHRNQKRRAKSVYHALVEDRILDHASAIVSTSERERAFIRDLGYSPPIWVIPVGVDAPALRAPADPKLVDGFGVPGAARVVTFLGRISAKKGVPLLVEAFKTIAESFPTAHLVVAGPDEEGIGRTLERSLATLGLSARVSFVGPVAGASKRALLQRSDAFVLPSEDESFGIAVAEAMAVGCPVVVTPAVAIQDLVRSAHAGAVVDRDSAALADALDRVLSDPIRAAAMGAAGKRVVDERFSWAAVAEQTESMYQAVVAGVGPPQPTAALS